MYPINENIIMIIKFQKLQGMSTLTKIASLDSFGYVEIY